MKRFCKRLKHTAIGIIAAIVATCTLTGVAMADMNGSDISGWQSADITSRVTSPDFWIVKATQGTSFVNRSWVQQINGAWNKGKAVGVYGFASGGSPEAEADFFVDTVGSWVGRAMLVLDWESEQNAAWGNGTWVDRWVKRVHDRTNVWPVVYVQKSAVWQISAYVRAHCMLWAAQYATTAATSFQSQPWNLGSAGEGMLQFTSNGWVDGVGPLDLDLFLGDRTAWQKIACGERKGCVPGSFNLTGQNPTVAPTNTKPNETVSELATRTIRGDFGNGSERKARLGASFEQVMAEVNRRLSSSDTRQSSSSTTGVCVVVKAGDTVSAIASRTGRQPASAWRVPSGNVNRIWPGQQVCYSGSTGIASATTSSGVHIVKAGETLSSIFGASGWQAAAQRNHLANPNLIFPGQQLI